MDIATLASNLHAFDLDITYIKKIDYGQQIRLACGVVTRPTVACSNADDNIW